MPDRTSALLFSFSIAGSVLLSASHALADDIRFSRDILPLLSENCFFCHGPDEHHRKGNLRLDTEAGALLVLNRDDPEHGDLLKRVLSDDPDLMMPPPDSNRHLTAAQKTTLKRWLESGSVWGRHWSFEDLKKPEVPDFAESDFPVRSPIDAFVQSRLLESGMTASEEADRRTLLRRVSLDLTGLPPTLSEVNGFLSDPSDSAYERIVDRLLASPAYGERMAWDWLDAARYADTNGYQGDNERTMWPWRDWVVQAFNSNMPYHEFTVLQLAGDLLPDASDDQKLATGFCRNHMINGEGGRIAEENRVDYVMDMCETMGTVWLGLTLNCCRCHDHKYDPLTQKDYYQLFAFFNQTPVDGGGGNAQTPPVLATPTADQQQTEAELTASIKSAQADLSALRQALLPGQVTWEAEVLKTQAAGIWKVLKPSTMKAVHQHLQLLDDDSVLVGGENAANDTYTLTLPLSPEVIGAEPLTALRLDALRHPSMTQGGIARSDSGNFVLTEIRAVLKGAEADQNIRIASANATFEQGSLTVSSAFDGNTSTGWAIYEGRPVDRDHAAVFVFAEPITVTARAELVVTLEHDSVHAFHNLGHFRLAVTTYPKPSLTDDQSTLLADLRTSSDARSDEQRKRIQNAWLNRDLDYVRLSSDLTRMEKQRDDLRRRFARVMVMEDRAEWRPTFMLNRGLYNDVTDHEVTAMTPASLPPLTVTGDRATRLDLARWLVSPQHPLTARVTVNRFWQQLFGVGLVKTAEDFGVQAEFPQYPDLLDWLAADFRDHGWDVKRLMKQIVMSHTYRQSSADRIIQQTDENGSAVSLSRIDPENRLLARSSRFRLPSWMLRDQTLACAGMLNGKPGGPSINTYQPDGVWEEATFGKKSYQQDTGEKLYRRSLYVFWRRIIAPTMFFDSASRQTCTVKPFRTNTPLHALLTLNETTWVESSRHLAQSLLADAALTTDADRIHRLFERILGRTATEDEIQILSGAIRRSRQQYEQHPQLATELLAVGASQGSSGHAPETLAAWTNACLTILNLDETLSHE
ncbi:MAG: PSD1 and planctomycete cytochrome C domain-containing protein [Planctomycetaceae bacterium]